MSIIITFEDFCEHDTIAKAIEVYCQESDEYATGRIGPDFATSGPGSGWSIQFDTQDFAARALDDEYGAIAYVDDEDGTVARLSEEGEVVWSEESEVDCETLSVREILEFPEKVKAYRKAVVPFLSDAKLTEWSEVDAWLADPGTAVLELAENSSDDWDCIVQALEKGITATEEMDSAEFFAKIMEFALESSRYCGSNADSEYLAEILRLGSKEVDWTVVAATTETEQLDPTDPDKVWVTETRQLVADEVVVAAWTVCACGFYSTGRGNPNHYNGWNVEEDTDGGDGCPEVLADALEELNADLYNKATGLPDVPEPSTPEEIPEDEANYCVLLRNPYSLGMEEFAPCGFYATAEDAQRAMNCYVREFEAEHGLQSYGPEWEVGEKNEKGEWIAMEDEQEGFRI